MPKGRQFALTWSIPDDFGGMTSALLHRSRAFVRLGGVTVDVLTFDARPDYAGVEARLREGGELIEGMRLLNLWDWLRAHEFDPDAAAHPNLGDPHFTALPLVHASGPTAMRLAPDGVTVLQVDYYRADGTLLASDRRDVHALGTPGGRLVVLCDSAGQPVRSWGSIWGLYRFWLDLLRNREPSFLIVDSKTVANFAMTYRRKRAVVVHVVHNSHMVGDEPVGELRASRRAVFENLGEFDAVVVLTQRQRRDVERLLGAAPNLRVIPNSRQLPARRLFDKRDPGRGITIASLTRRKQVDHAVRAIAAAADEVPVCLDIFGEGPEHESIARLAAASPAVRIRGYHPRARQQLETASFILLTGRSEGFPLVLVEAMAAGCIPIAYDVRYGPADLIESGRNGFLVAPGDEKALADAIIALQRMPWHRVSRLRRNARRSAARFSDLAVTRLWAGELMDAAALKAAAWQRVTA